MSQFNYQKICSTLVNSLPEKQKEVLQRRFGLTGINKETLQKIGSDFCVTRERVRQIEKDALQRLQKYQEDKTIQIMFTHFKEYLKAQGRIKKEDVLLADLGEGNFQNQVYFLLVLGDEFNRFSEDDDVFAFWACEKEPAHAVKEFLQKAFQKLSQAKRCLAESEIVEKEYSVDFCLSAIEISKKIDKSPLGSFGLTAWRDVKPKGVRDGAFLVLKKFQKPLHFRQIANLFSEFDNEFFKTRKALPQTVHNELIRDPRFVLVGRGIYGLKEWGYKPGTVKDVIIDVLKSSASPLSKDVIIKQVLSQRLVKPTTILLSLNDKKYFNRDSVGKYFVREI